LRSFHISIPEDLTNKVKPKQMQKTLKALRETFFPGLNKVSMFLPTNAASPELRNLWKRY
jgi:hypothetical protein